jgi:hypothetical protein
MIVLMLTHQAGCRNLRLVMLIRYQNSTSREGVILSLAGDVMRVALRNDDDVTEFRLVNGVWLAADLTLVTFDFTLCVLAAVGIEPADDATLPEGHEATLPVTLPSLDGPAAGYVN